MSKKVYEYWINKIKASNIPKRNKELILKFADECYNQELSYARIRFYLAKLWVIQTMVRKDLDRLNKDDIKALVRKIREKNYSDWTIYGYKCVIKKFYQWLSGKEWNSKEYPDKVKWIKITMKNNLEKLPEEVLTEEEVRRMIDHANRPRDKALISVLYESGCRISELLNVQLKHVTFDDYGCVIFVNGKTGPRRIRLVSSVPHLSTWLQNHSGRKNKESYLWIGRKTEQKVEGNKKRESKKTTPKVKGREKKRKDEETTPVKHLSHYSVRRILKEVAKKSRINKPVNPHAFRHSRATHLASHLTEAQMKEVLGWSQSSKMASIYVHLSGRDVDKSILKMYGIIPEEERGKESGIKFCSICHERNSIEDKYCRSCGTSLDPKVVVEKQRREREVLSLLTPEMVEKMIELKKLLLEKEQTDWKV